MRIIFLILFISCTSSPSLKWENSKKRTKASERLSPQQMNEDKLILRTALTKAYSGYFFKNKETIDKGLSDIENITSSITINDFCRKLATAFSRVVDNHLVIKHRGKNCSPLYNKNKAKSKRYKSHLNKPWIVEQLHSKDKISLIIAIAYFYSSSSSKWSGFFEKIKQLLPKSDQVILDLRGNGGGDDSTGYQLATLLAGNKEISTPYESQYKVVTKEGLESRANYFKLMKSNTKSQKEKTFFQNLIDKDKILYANSKEKVVKINLQKKETKKIKLDKKIYILQDDSCGSSCESSIDFFEYLSPVVKVGQNTGGYIHFGNLGFVILPNSLIQVDIASTYNMYKDERFVERIGIKPDIVLNPNIDSLNYVLSLK